MKKTVLFGKTYLFIFDFVFAMFCLSVGSFALPIQQIDKYSTEYSVFTEVEGLVSISGLLNEENNQLNELSGWYNEYFIH